MSLVPGKIVLKSSTSKTLSDRFGEIAKTSHVVENIRTTQREDAYASVKNRRLAAHMAKRLKQAEDPPLPSPKKNTIKSRLGLPITSRLGNKRGGAVRGRGGRGRPGQRVTRSQGLMGPVRFQRGGGQARRGGRGQSRGQTRGRGGGRGGRGGPNQFTQRGRGGRGRGRGKKLVSQAQLDTELDTYMSKTKSVLNAELDKYMQDAGE